MTLAQTPQPNAGVDQPVVNLLLSSPTRAAKGFVMPSVVGMKEIAASQWAAGMGLKVVTRTTEISAPPPADPEQPAPARAGSKAASSDSVVAAQWPESGFKASPGDVLLLTVEPSAASSPLPAPSASPSPE